MWLLNNEYKLFAAGMPCCSDITLLLAFKFVRRITKGIFRSSLLRVNESAFSGLNFASVCDFIIKLYWYMYIVNTVSVQFIDNLWLRPLEASRGT